MSDRINIIGHSKLTAKHIHNETFTRFDSAQEAWFWFINAYQAKHDGARIVKGLGLVERPCEPLDILKAVDRLYRQRRLIWDHLLVLRHYGQRQMAPDPHRPNEMKAAALWDEAMKKLSEVLIRKQIVRAPTHITISNKSSNANSFENQT